MIIFTPQIIILAITGLINLAMSVFVFSRGIKNKVNLYFSIITFFNFLWAISLMVFKITENLDILRLFASLPYTMAWLVIVFLFYFSLHFPYESPRINRVYKWFINIFSFFIILYTTFGYKFFVENVVVKPNHITNYNIVVYTIYAIFMMILVFSSIFILNHKYRKTSGIFKRQIRLVLWGVILGTLFGCYFNLFLMYVDNFNYIHVGPLFTLFINFIVLGFIISPKEKISN